MVRIRSAANSRRVEKSIAYWIFIALLYVAALPGYSKTSKQPAPTGGILDLRQWDFVKDGSVTLSGNWDFYFGDFLEASQFDSMEPRDSLAVPDVWNGHPWQGRKLRALGFASYRLRILLPTGHPALSIVIPNQGTTFAAFLNGKPLCANGIPGKSRETNVPYARIMVRDIQPQPDTLVLIMHLANYEYRKGGIWKSPTLGEKSAIERSHQLQGYLSTASAGMFLLLSFTLLCFYYYRPKEKSALYFSLVSLACMFRIISTDDLLLVELFPGVSWDLMRKLEIGSMQGVMLFNVIALYHLFPKEVGRWFVRVVTPVYSLTLAVIIASTLISSYMVPTMQVMMLVVLVYMTVAIFRALFLGRDGAIVLAIAMVVSLALAIQGVLANSGIITYYPPVTFTFPLIFGLMQVILYSRIFGRSLSRIEKFADELEITVKERTEELRIEKEKSESLLLNVLPDSIARRLKKGEKTIADHFEIASVIFIDIVDFTRTSEKTSPVEMVKLLNDIFTRFDHISAKYGLEKIKTIGDCYMAASGIPDASPDHARAAVNMALEVVNAMEDFRLTLPGEKEPIPIRFRIGLDCGDTVAGVIGQTKFIYDLWGDMVNTASRMESHGEPGRIHCTDRFRKQIEAHESGLGITLVDRGEISIKGKGLMRTWFIQGVKGFTSSPPSSSPPMYHY